jgi:hypothetical protein
MLMPQSTKPTTPREGFFEVTYRVKESNDDMAIHCLAAKGFVLAMTAFQALSIGKPAYIREIPSKEYLAWQTAQQAAKEAA